MRLLICTALVLVLNSCASSEKPEPKVRTAAMGMDTFTIEQGMPVRDVKKQDFFYKHCELESRRAFTSRVEYSCNDSLLSN